MYWRRCIGSITLVATAADAACRDIGQLPIEYDAIRPHKYAALWHYRLHRELYHFRSSPVWMELDY